MDPFACYELCVQSPGRVARFLHALHGNSPLALREDFCGTAAVSRRWVREAIKRGDLDARALGVEIDAATCARARADIEREGWSHHVRIVQGDCEEGLETHHPADVVFVGNFSLGYLPTRPRLLAYFRHAHRSLSRGSGGFGGGVFACDTYGGAGAFRLGELRRVHTAPTGEQVHYQWLHEEADPRSAMVTNSISFRVVLNGDVIAEFPRAFVYRWRLWSIPEIIEAMRECGFLETGVYKDVDLPPGVPPRAVEDPRELGEDWVVVVAGRVGAS
jgi:hypothetical protein